MLTVLVLIFAFLASSFAAHNSDFWLHLASGRLLAERRFQFGVDPFTFTTESCYWANHAWLFDLPLFLIYTHFGGTILVVLKASLISFLAALLLRVRRPDKGVNWPVTCTLLAILAMSPRLLLHSTCLSYVLLGLALWLLWRPHKLSASFGRQLRHYAPVLLLFVLWVNVDDWFLLGPLLAGLFWLGDWIESDRASGEMPRRTPGWLWLAGLGVCLINPYHFRTFTLPVELMPLPSALRHDIRFEPLHASPWQKNLYYNSLAGINWANGAYLVLLAGGGLSFLLNRRRLVGWRLLVWLTFAGLSAWLARSIPFFAVVAAPITALNLQEAFPPVPERYSSSRRFLDSLARFSLVMAGLALSGLAWLGWLQGFQNIGRHVNWTVQIDGSLKQVAERLHLWHQQDKLGKGRGFLSHPSVVHYCAYFCPEEKGFLDYRVQLFHHVTDEYEQICRSLHVGIGRNDPQPVGDGRLLLRKYGITHLVLYDASLLRLAPALEHLAASKKTWRLLDVDGQALIVGWRDDSRMLPERVPTFDADRLAFTTALNGEEKAKFPTAPSRGIERAPRSSDFWSLFRKPIAPSPWETAAAGVLLHYFEDREPFERQRRAIRCFGWVAALPALPALSVNSLDGLLRLGIAIEQAPLALQDLSQQPPALPLLAVRAARAALAQNPDDVSAYLSLGRAYLDLTGRTPERAVLDYLSPLAEIRQIQIATTLQNVLQLNPDSLIAHEQLAALYEARGFLDVALDHHRAALRLARRTGSLPGESPAVFAQRMEQKEQTVKTLERLVNDRKNEFTLQTRDLGSEPLPRAQIALRQGLARLALDDILATSSVLLLRGEGITLQVQLQLLLGRLDAVRSQLADSDWKAHKANLGSVNLFAPGDSTVPTYRLPGYEWLLLCQTAADGDYEQANAALQALIHELGGKRAVEEIRKYQHSLPLLVTSEVGWAAQPQLWLMSRRINQERSFQSNALNLLMRSVVQQADMHVLAGMLALERGRPQDAENSFLSATLLDRLVSDGRRSRAGQMLANTYLRILKAAQR